MARKKRRRGKERGKKKKGKKKRKEEKLIDELVFYLQIVSILKVFAAFETSYWQPLSVRVKSYYCYSKSKNLCL